MEKGLLELNGCSGVKRMKEALCSETKQDWLHMDTHNKKVLTMMKFMLQLLELRPFEYSLPMPPVII